MVEEWKGVATNHHAMDRTASIGRKSIRGWRGSSRGVAAAQLLKCG